jgi:hypothetical protein
MPKTSPRGQPSHRHLVDPRRQPTRWWASIPLAVDLTKRSNWGAGVKKWEFQVFRLHVGLQDSWQQNDVGIVAVSSDQIRRDEQGRQRSIEIITADLLEAVRKQLLREELVGPLSDAIAGFSGRDGVKGRSQEARRAVRAALLPRYWDGPESLSTEPLSFNVPLRTANDDEWGIAYVRRTTEVNLSYIDFLNITYRLEAGRLRLRRMKSPWVQANSDYRVNELDLEGMPLGTFSTWSPLGLVRNPPKGGFEPSPQSVSFKTDGKTTPALGRHAFPALPTLYKISNVAFPMLPSLVEEREWTDDWLLELEIEADDTQAWLKHIATSIDSAPRLIRGSIKGRRGNRSSIWK